METAAEVFKRIESKEFNLEDEMIGIKINKVVTPDPKQQCKC
jgi:hypothetical protein